MAIRFRTRRVLLVVGAAASFTLLASLFVPRDSQAASSADEGAPAPLIIGTLTGPRYHVRITTGRGEPRYTVLSTDGEVLEANLLADEVYHFFPDLDVTSLRGEGTIIGPLMLAE